MNRFGLCVVVLSVVLGCDSEGTPIDGGGRDTAGDTGIIDAGLDAAGDGGVPDEERPTTLSPLACQTDLEILREEDPEIRVHPLDHKGEIFGLRNDGTDVVLTALVSGTVLARAGQMVTGFGEETLRFDTLFDPTEIAVAPDFGRDNSPDYPVAFNATLSETGRVLVRSDEEGGLAKVVAQGDALSLRHGGMLISGTAAGVEQVRVSSNGTVMFVVALEESTDRYLVQQRGPGAGVQLVVGENTTLDDTYRVASIESYDLVETPLVRVGVKTDGAQIGFAYVRSEGGVYQCVLTDTPYPCPGGVSISEGERVDFEDFGSDGFSTGAVVRSGSTASLRYRSGGTPGRGSAPAVIERGVEVQGFSFNNFRSPAPANETTRSSSSVSSTRTRPPLTTSSCG